MNRKKRGKTEGRKQDKDTKKKDTKKLNKQFTKLKE